MANTNLGTIDVLVRLSEGELLSQADRLGSKTGQRLADAFNKEFISGVNGALSSVENLFKRNNYNLVFKSDSLKGLTTDLITLRNLTSKTNTISFNAKGLAEMETRLANIYKLRDNIGSISTEVKVSGATSGNDQDLKKYFSSLEKTVRQSSSKRGVVGNLTSGFFDGITNDLGMNVSRGLGLSKISSKAATNTRALIKTANQYFIDIETTSAAFLAEFIRTGSAKSAVKSAARQSPIKKTMDGFRKMMTLAQMDLTKLDENIDSPDLKPFFDGLSGDVKAKIQKRGAASTIFKDDKLKQQFLDYIDSKLAEYRPDQFLDGFVRSTMNNIAPIKNYIAKIQNFQHLSTAQDRVNSGNASLPPLTQNQTGYMQMIGGAQFKGGEGHRSLVNAFEAIFPDSRMIGIANPDTDPGGKATNNLTSMILKMVQSAAPDLAGNQEIANTLVNALTMLTNAIDPTKTSAAVVDSLTNILLAEQQGIDPSKVGTMSYSMGGADAKALAETLNLAGITSPVHALAYPDLNFSGQNLPNFTASLLKEDALGFAKNQLNLGGNQNQRIYQAGILPGAQAHAYSHYFKNPEQVTALYSQLGKEQPQTVKAPDYLSKAASYHEVVGSMLQAQSLLDSGDFDSNIPTKGFKASDNISGLDVFAKVVEGATTLTGADIKGMSPEMLAIRAKLKESLLETYRAIVDKMIESGANISPNIKPGDLLGYFKFQEQLDTYNSTIDTFKTGQVTEGKGYFAGELDKTKVQQRLADVDKASTWMRGNLRESPEYKEKVLAVFANMRAMMEEYIKTGKVSEATFAKIQPIKPDQLSEEFNNLTNKKFDDSTSPGIEDLDTNQTFLEYALQYQEFVKKVERTENQIKEKIEELKKTEPLLVPLNITDNTKDTIDLEPKTTEEKKSIAVPVDVVDDQGRTINIQSKSKSNDKQTVNNKRFQLNVVQKQTARTIQEILDDADQITVAVADLYKDFQKAKKSGDVELAKQKALAVKEYAAKFADGLIEARESVSGDIKYTKASNQLGQKQSQLARKFNTVDRYLAIQNAEPVSPIQAVGQGVRIASRLAGRGVKATYTAATSEQAQNAVKTGGALAVKGGQLALDAATSEVAQKALRGTVTIAARFIKGVASTYALLADTEKAVLSLIPYGSLVKTGIQVAAAPALAASVSHLLPGAGAAISGALDAAGAAGGAVGNMAGANIAGNITSHLPQVFGIQQGAASTVQATSNLIGSWMAEGAVLVLGSGAAHAGSKAIAGSKPSKTVAALPAATQQSTTPALPSAKRQSSTSDAVQAVTAEIVDDSDEAIKKAIAEVVASAKKAGQEIKTLYNKFSKAQKKGNENLAYSLGVEIQSYIEDYETSISNAKKQFGSKAFGSELKGTNNSVTKARKSVSGFMQQQTGMRSAAVADDPWEEIGSDVGQGLAEGSKKQARQAGVEIGKEVQKGAKDELEIQSPSKRFFKIGQQIVEGLAEGVNNASYTDAQEGFDKIADNLAEKLNIGVKSFDTFVSNIPGLKGALVVGGGALAAFTIGINAVKAAIDFTQPFVQAAQDVERFSIQMQFAEGSTRKAAESIKYAKNLAKELGSNQVTSIDAFAGLSASTKDTNLEGLATQQIFEGFSKAGVSRQLTKEQTDGMFLAVKQISDKGVVSQEELRGQLSERLAGTMAVAARSRGQTVQEMNKDIKTGTVTSDEFLPKFAQQFSAESALSLPGAMESSVAVTNRFQNAIEELQATVGQGIIPVQNTGYKVFTEMINGLTSSLPVIINLLGTALASSLFSVLRALVTSGVAGSSFKLILTSIGDLALKMLPTVTTLALKFVAFTAVVEVFKAVGSVIADASGELRGFADTAQKGLEKFHELNNQFQNRNQKKIKSDELPETALVDGTMLSGLAKSVDDESSWGDRIGYGARWLLGGAERNSQAILKFGTGGAVGGTYAEKRANDRLIAGSDIATTAASTTNEMQQQLAQADSALQKVIEADKALDSVTQKRRAIIATNPSNSAALKQLKEEEQLILKNREAASKPLGVLQAENQVTIDNLKAAIEEFETLAATPGENQGQYKDKLTALKLELQAAESTQTKFNAALKSGIDAFTLFTTRMGRAFDRLTDGTEAIKNAAMAAKVSTINDQMTGGITSAQAGLQMTTIDISALQEQIDKTASSISEMEALLESQQGVLKAYGVDGKGQAELGTLAEKASNPKDKAAIENYTKVQSLKQSQNQLKLELAQQQQQAQQQLEETTKSVNEFFKEIKNQTQQLALDTKSAQNKVAMMKAETKLRTALLGFQENFVTSYVDSLVGFLKTLNKPLEDTIVAQGQLLQNQQGLSNTLQQGQQLSNQIGVDSAQSANIPKKLAGSISGRLDASGQNGADMPVGPNNEMKSYHTGIVKELGRAGNNGNYVVVEYLTQQGEKLEATYSHIGAIVKKGQQVIAGQVLGKFDASGRTFGAHNSIDINSPGSNGALQRSQESAAARREADRLVQGYTSGRLMGGSVQSVQSIGSGSVVPKGVNDIQRRNAAIIEREGQARGLNRNQIAAMITGAQQESTLGMAKDEIGGYGGKGLFQLTDAAGQSGSWIGKGGIRSIKDYYDPVKNTRAVMTDYQFNAWKERSKGMSVPDASSAFARMVLRPYQVGTKYSDRAKELYPSGVAGGQALNTSNTANRANVDSATSQAIVNSQQQANNITSQLAASGQLDKLQAQLQKQSSQRQLKTGLRDAQEGVLQSERRVEDIGAGIGADTPTKQRALQERDAQRQFYDLNKDLLKQLDDLRAAKGTMEAALAIIKAGGFQGADQLKDQIPLLEKGAAETGANINKIEALVSQGVKLRDSKIEDINQKFAQQEEQRKAEAASEIANLVSTRQKLESDLSALTDGKSNGVGAIDNRSKSEIAEKQAAYAVEMKRLDELERTEQRTKQEVAQIRQLKGEILAQEIGINEAQAARDKEAIRVQIRDKTFDSEQSLNSARAGYLDSIGRKGDGDKLRYDADVANVNMDYTKGIADIDAFARATGATNEEVMKLKNNLEELRNVKLDTLASGMDRPKQALIEIGQTVQSSLGSALKDVITGAKTAEEAFAAFIDSMLSKLIDMMMNEIFSNLFGGGGLGGLFGGLLGGGGGGGLLGGLLGGGGGIFGGGLGGGGGILGGAASLLGGNMMGGLGLFHTGRNAYIKNYADGKSAISDAMSKEKRESGANPLLAMVAGQLAVVNDREIILSKKESERFMELGLNRLVSVPNFAGGNMPTPLSMSGSGDTTTINVPVTIEGDKGSGDNGKGKPQLDIAKLRESIKATVQQEIQQSKRNGGSLSR